MRLRVRVRVMARVMLRVRIRARVQRQGQGSAAIYVTHLRLGEVGLRGILTTARGDN